MNGACGTNGSDEKRVHIVVKKLKERDNFQYVFVDGRIILKQKPK
jgi:hypothetical protein